MIRSRILFIHPALRKYRFELFESLSVRGVDFLFSMVNQNPHEKEESSRLMKQFKGRFWQAKEWKSWPVNNLSWSLGKAFRYKIVVFSGVTSAPFLVLAPLLKLLGKKIWLFDEAWCYPRTRPIHRLVRRYIGFLLQFCVSRVLVAGSKSFEFFKDEFGYPENQLSILANTTYRGSQWMEKVSPHEALHSEVEKRSQGQSVVLYLGRLVECKGLDILIEAIADIPSLFLMVVGNGPKLEEYRGLAKKRFNSERYWFYGSCSSSESHNFYSCSQVFVLPGRFLDSTSSESYESWGYTINEAMYAGLPVISTTAVGAAFDLIEDGKTGYRVSQGKVGPLVSALRKVADDPQKALEMGGLGSKRIQELHNVEYLVKVFFDEVESKKVAL